MFGVVVRDVLLFFGPLIPCRTLCPNLNAMWEYWSMGYLNMLLDFGQSVRQTVFFAQSLVLFD